MCHAVFALSDVSPSKCLYAGECILGDFGSALELGKSIHLLIGQLNLSLVGPMAYATSLNFVGTGQPTAHNNCCIFMVAAGSPRYLRDIGGSRQGCLVGRQTLGLVKLARERVQCLFSIFDQVLTHAIRLPYWLKRVISLLASIDLQSERP